MNHTIRVQRKYFIYTKFLDTILESEDVIQDGETRQQAMTRVRLELDAIADEWRREATVNGLINPDNWERITDFPEGKKTQIEFGSTTPIIIDRALTDKLEIAIDNATTLEDLDRIKESNPVFPGRLLTVFNNKRQQLKSE